MSGGSGQMPMASNKGQQMQNPQMGQQGMMGQMPPQGGMQGNSMYTPGGVNPNAVGDPFGSQQQMNGLFGGMPQMPPQMSPVVEGRPVAPQFAQMQPLDPMIRQQAFDQYMAQQGGMGGMQPAMGIAALGGQMPQRYDGVGDSNGMGLPKFVPPPYMEGQIPTKGAMGAPMDYGTPRFPPQGMPQTQPPYQPYMGGPDIKPTNMGKPEGMLPAGGMPPGFRPTSIDGRRLRDMMDITKRRFMGNMGGMRGRDEGDQDRLPGAIGNDLPPALRRPTQGGYKNFK
jgi:hypothetical protein